MEWCVNRNTFAEKSLGFVVLLSEKVVGFVKDFLVGAVHVPMSHIVTSFLIHQLAFQQFLVRLTRQ